MRGSGFGESTFIVNYSGEVEHWGEELVLECTRRVVLFGGLWSPNYL